MVLTLTETERLFIQRRSGITCDTALEERIPEESSRPLLTRHPDLHETRYRVGGFCRCVHSGLSCWLGDNESSPWRLHTASYGFAEVQLRSVKGGFFSDLNWMARTVQVSPTTPCRKIAKAKVCYHCASLGK